MPSTAQAQFGAFKKAKEAIEKAKAAKAKVDSVKATVDNAKNLVSGATGGHETSVTIDEKVFAQFTAAYAVEKIALTDKKPEEAAEAAAKAAQLTTEEYGAVKTKVVGYALARARKGDMPSLTDDEKKVLDAHEKTITALVEVK